MERLTIDEVIAHCQRICEKTEMIAVAQGKTQDEITSKQYWEHYQVCGWLEELKHYKDLDQQGLFVKLPCVVGSTVYIPVTNYYIGLTKFNKKKVLQATVLRVEALENEIRITTKNGVEYMRFSPDDFGKTIFTDRQQAEQALKEMEGENE